MTEALNYTTKAIADVMAMSKKSPPGQKVGLRFIAEKLRQAQVFVLPDRGALFDRSKPYPQVPASILKPPFPVVALEYHWPKEEDWQPTSFYNAVSCSRRISLAWEWDGRTPDGKLVSDPEPGCGVAVASIVYHDGWKRWAPIWAAVITDYEAAYVAKHDPVLTAELIQAGRTTAAQAARPTLEVRDILVLMPEAAAQTRLEYGSAAAFRSLSADLMDELNAYRDLCLALACANVGKEKHAAPEKLNRARIRSGKPPLKDFHVLTIAGQGDGEAFGSDNHGGARSHLRRGHVRRLGPDRITWVNATMVRGRQPGFVDKQYAVRN
jgi:hypothetical protein